jgi:glucokinase
VTRAALGFDVGGQSIKAVLLSAEGRTLAEGKRATGLEIDAKGLITAIGALVAELSARAPRGVRILQTLGSGVAGVMASDGILAGSPNLPNCVGHCMRKVLSDGLGRPVAVDNDANCAALAESWAGGAAEGIANFLLITLGSGVGSGLVLGGKLYHGATGYACELGHTIVSANGRLCGCGNRGCLEAYVSESAVRAYAHESEDRTAAEVARLVANEHLGYAQALFGLADQGHAGAVRAVDEMIAMLGIGLASAVNLLDVPTIVIGGGIAPAALGRERGLRAAMASALFSRPASAITILAARRGADAGAVGAARMAMLADANPGG